jgi:8-oxo-dGTP pyrophosphatase MutT (NUDIX family)
MDKDREKSVYEGQLFEVLRIPDPNQEGRFFEVARRGPGTRIIFTDGSRILLTREFRRELGGYDVRLPGGKVFDTLSGYRSALVDGVSLVSLAQEGASREAVEEVGLEPRSLEFLHRSVCGATVEWDIYFFVCREWTEVGRTHADPGEDITVGWHSFDRARNMALTGDMLDERSALQVLRFLEGL